MKIKTNITIASNIFIRTDSNIRYDSAFAEQVRGRSALSKLKSQYGSIADGIRLADWQEEMHREDNSCSHAKNGEKTHGPVRKNGRIVWVGRCEYSACPGFGECGAASRTVRMSAEDESTKTDAGGKEPLIYEWLGNIDSLFEKNEAESQIVEEALAPELIIEDIKSFAAEEEYKKIDSPVCIIEDDIESKILVNAAPGSGKTYTVMRRLEYIIRNQLVNDFSNLLVLVYTNAAKKEILRRLETGVSDGTLPYSARNVDVCTFDSLATSYLAMGEEQFSQLNYNERIRLFNEKFVPDDFSDFEYVVVDELQDLVNDRAKMVLNILGALEGGYLLLGDKCQAIYDYDCHDGDNISSVEFYKKLGEVLPDDVKRYELTGNQRQSDRLALVSDKFRHALLSYDSMKANQMIADEIGQIESVGAVEKFDFHAIKTRTAILCRSNGEAEYVSHILNKNKIHHGLLRGVAHEASLHRFIADCFWDYHNERITRTEFVDRYCARVKDDGKTASDIFDILSETVYENVKEVIEFEKLVHVLGSRATKLAPILTNEENSLITVSTIHKAKGHEFDTVYLLDSGFHPEMDNTEEARVWYVGCTRAKGNLFRLGRENIELRRSVTCNTRWVQLKNHRVRWKTQLMKHCCNVVLGLPMDIDESGFADEDFSRALDRQEYIAEKVRVGDSVEIVWTEAKYHIKHLGNTVGYLTDHMYSQLWNIVRESNSGSGHPLHLEPVYVADIVTITPRSFPDGVDSYFRESRFWLGLELTGFPKVDWRYN